MTLRVRELNDHERVEVPRLARSHTLGAGLVRRARIVVPGSSCVPWTGGRGRRSPPGWICAAPRCATG